MIHRLRRLFNLHLSAQDACEGFYSKVPPIVRLPQAVHTAVFAPTGVGKGVAGVIPFLLTCPESCVILDFKGENAKLTAEHRREKFGHQIVQLDPYRAVTQTPDSLNPVEFIDKDNPQALDECNDLANALVLRTGEERDPHWNESAMAFIAGVIATVAYYGEAQQGTRSLQAVRDILSNPQKLETAIKLMCESDAWGGMLARMGGQLNYFIEKEKMSTLTTVARHMRFLDTPAVAENTRSSTFNPAGLRRSRMTVYLILPPEHMRAQAALLRMWIGSLLRACVREGLQS
jgi:type IV secretion system protein VirD4